MASRPPNLNVKDNEDNEDKITDISTGRSESRSPKECYGMTPPPINNLIYNGVVFDDSLCQLLEKGSRAFAIVDWCSPKYNGSAEFHYMSSRWCELHNWSERKTNKQLADGITNNMREWQLGIKKRVQYELTPSVEEKTLNMGRMNFTIIPINYKPTDHHEGYVATLVFLTRVLLPGEQPSSSAGQGSVKADHSGDVWQEIKRAAKCFDYSSDFVSLMKPEGGILLQNMRARNFYLGTNWKDIDLATFDIMKTLMKEEEYYKYQKTVIKDKGEFFARVEITEGIWHLVRAAACFDPAHEQAPAVVVSQTDITRTVRLELEENQRKDMLFGIVSHELKTPLNGIISLAEVLGEELREYIEPHQLKTLQIIKQSGMRLNNLVTNLLDASLLREKQLCVRMEDNVNLHALVEAVIQLSESSVKFGVKLINAVPLDFPGFKGDEARLTQIVSNLVNNAAKFTGKGHIKVIAELKKAKRSKKRLRQGQDICIHIEDTGMGIPEAKQQLIFEALRQVDEGPTRKHGGTGLGLHIARGLAQAMGGNLRVKSKIDEGSTFTCVLPILQSGPTSAVRPSGIGSPMGSTNSNSSVTPFLSSGEGTPGNPVTIHEDFEAMSSCSDVTGQTEVLSVDDEPANQAVVKALLKIRNFKITTAMDGIEALEILEERRKKNGYMPDVILLDVMMPRMNGFECCGKIRGMFPLCAVPIIMVSANHREENIVQGLNIGSNDYVGKPFKKMELLARIDTQLKLRQAWRTELEREKADLLLHKMLPHHIIDRLKEPALSAGRNYIAEEHEDVTILFSDVVGFTKLASTTPTIDIIWMLNELFTRFDALTERHGVYKVETIGDAYMVAAGHDHNELYQDDPTLRVMRMAQDMLQCVEEMRLEIMREKLKQNGAENKADTSSGLQIRIGIHCGPAYSGVVGTKMPRYCFFGDTVNTASRMESTSFPMCIQVSEFVYKKVRGDSLDGPYLEPDELLSPRIRRVSSAEYTYQSEFEFKEFGKREIKGKGEMRTYLVAVGDYASALTAKKIKAASPNVQEAVEEKKEALEETYHRARFRPSLVRAQSPFDKRESVVASNRANVAESRSRELEEKLAAEIARGEELQAKLEEAKQRQADAEFAREQMDNRLTKMLTQQHNNQPNTTSPEPEVFKERAYLIERAPPSQWTDEAVSVWLVASFTPSFGAKYMRVFEEAAINGAMLLSLQDKDLQQLGITNSFHRQRLHHEIELLIQRDSELRAFSNVLPYSGSSGYGSGSGFPASPVSTSPLMPKLEARDE